MNEKKLSSIENYVIGALTGLAEVLITNPFFVLKINMQQNKPWVLKPAAYYKGVMTNAIGFVPTTAIQVGANKWIQSTLFNNQPTYAEQTGAAFTAGVLSSFVSCPIEMIRTLQNNHPETRLPTLLNRQLTSKGLSHLFVGQLATSLREGGFSVFFLAAPPVIKSKLRSYGMDDTTSHLVAGISSGVAATIITQPADTIKTTQQSATNSNVGFFKTAKMITLPGLVKGILPRSSCVILSITVMDWIKDQLEDLCKEHGDAIYGKKSLK